MANLISIITVTYNAEEFIAPTLLSVANQSFHDFEYILIDGASDDLTLDIVSNYKEYVDVFISKKDNGIYDAMNTGLRISKGQYVLFLNAGDTFVDDDVLKRISKNLDGSIRILSGDFYKIKSLDEKKGVLIRTRACTIENLRRDFSACHQAIFMHRSVASDYDLRYRILADYKWVVRAAEKCGSSEISLISEPFVKYLDGGISSKNIVQNFRERIMLHLELFGIFQVFYNTPNYLRRFLRELKRCKV